ncbi:MFS transporter [Hamadaea tsunoensis]|uniref:MFS transporter n=1 Tax=Hamadaea tsunoensis TaxID=53368 RepID=UPI000489FEBB|nr:MFS transporter [Hamadaea tsunoensis]
MGSTTGLFDKILPPPGISRRLAFQSAVIATGGGTFQTGSVVFFTHVVGLSPVQIGVGFSVVGFAGLVASLPLGHVADRIGGKRAWVLGALAEAACFALYPFARGFWTFLALVVVGSLADVLANGGRTVYTAAALPTEIRVRSMAFMRAYLNVGFTIGAGLGAAALALNSTAGLIALVAVNAVGLVVNALVVSRMPEVHAGPRTQRRTSPWGVLRDHPFSALALVFMLIWLHSTIFMEILPLWAITKTDVPKPVLGALFALNTVLAVLLQVPATRGADSLPGSVRLLRWGGIAAAVACPVLALSGRTHGWATVAVLALGVVLTTATELWSSAAQWYMQTELPPADQRGAYVGASRSIGGIGRMVGPAALTFLAIQTGGWGWWVIAVIFVVATLAVRPVVDWVGRTPRNGAPVPVLAEAAASA